MTRFAKLAANASNQQQIVSKQDAVLKVSVTPLTTAVREKVNEGLKHGKAAAESPRNK